MDNLDFYRELMLLLCDPEHKFSKKIYKYMYGLKGMILYGEDMSSKSVFFGDTNIEMISPNEPVDHWLCYVAFKICKVLKRRLPDSIHNRMVLGRKYGYVEKYIKYCVKHKLN